MNETTSNSRKIGGRILVYLGSAWVLIEAFNFFIERFNLDQVFLDLFMILIAFGLPATLIYSTLTGRFNRKAVVLQILNGIGLLVVIFYFLAHPLFFTPSDLRVLKLSGDKKSALESLNSIAVLPFSNNMGDASQDYLLAGMHDGLITEIGRLGSIHIISRTSTLPYVNSGKSLKMIAKELSVDAVVEASFTRADASLELSVKLISAYPEERLLWSHSYSTTMGELPNLYKEVTRNVALKINDAINPIEMEKLQPVRTVNPGAYEAYLQGKYHTGYLTPEAFALARKYFEKAIEIDSLFAPSYAGISGVWGSMKQMGYVSPRVVNPIVDELQQKAYNLDSTNSEILMGKAAIYTWSGFEWKLADEFFQRSIDQNPNDAVTRAFYAHYLMILNRWDEGWDQMKYAVELDPQNPWVIAFNATMYFLDGKMLSALRESEHLMKIAPDHPMMVQILLGKFIAQKKYGMAVGELKKMVGRTAITGLDELIDKEFESGDFMGMINVLAIRLEEESQDQFVSPKIINQLYQFTGNVEKQLFWMEKMFEIRDPNLPYFAIRNSNPIQKHPTYILIMEEMGLW